MNSKKWIKIFVVLSFFGVLFVGGVNYVVDPYGTNNTFSFKLNQSKHGSTKRPLHFKLPFLKQGNIDTIMLGTSRIGVMKTETLNKYLEGNIFNLSSPSSLSDEQYYILKYAIDNNKIKNVLYSIDFMSLNGVKKELSSDFEEIKENIINNEGIKDDFLIYFSLDSLKYSFKMLLGKKDTTYLSDGRRDYQLIKQKIENNSFKLDYNPQSLFTNTQYSPYKYSDKKMDFIRKIITLCKKENINLIFYTPPMYAEHFINIYKNKEKDFILFKKELVKLTNYIDLSGINTISLNKNNYYDASHLRDTLSEIIFAKIFNDNSIKVPKDFGVLVTKQNIDQHLKNLKKQVENYDLEKALAK